jgi:hypothetical protein
VYNLHQGFYDFKPIILALKRQPDGSYSPVPDIVVTSVTRSGFGVEVADFMNGSENTLAFHIAELYTNDILRSRITLDDIGYDETRYLHAYADYPTHFTSGRWFQCLFQLWGNSLNRVYEHVKMDASERGIVNVGNGDTTRIRIVLTDAAGNETIIRFRATHTGQKVSPPQRTCNSDWTILDPKNHEGKYEGTNLRFIMPRNALYDYICYDATRKTQASAFSLRYGVGIASIPVHAYFDLFLKPTKPVPFSLRQKMALLYSDGKKTSGRAAVPEAGGWYKASVRAFGEYWLAADTAAPVVKPIGAVSGPLKAQKSIAISAIDAATSVKSFRGEVDSKWVLFEQHGNTWTYVFDEHCPPGKHRLSILATDEVGNETRKQFSFVR